jgi:hypothetical protein
MNIDEQIIINKFGQDLSAFHDLLNLFQSKEKKKRNF